MADLFLKYYTDLAEGGIKGETPQPLLSYMKLSPGIKPKTLEVKDTCDDCKYQGHPSVHHYMTSST